ncbi:hypothetical protein E4U60_002920 [Claviceps pazoutovae]|uniref:S-adenosyl-L-methionine-dependent methyltransferase n=1 Tax=Claviceps pazoutovae TaxID=1649127 RepID=A0A9P7SJL2_9HYPO|nr:hypothetical protein E4U60_002920 [Claviceps pazoutovae]
MLEDKKYMYCGLKYEPDTDRTVSGGEPRGFSVTNSYSSDGRLERKSRQSGEKGYLLPVDENESDRLDFQHKLYLKVMDGNLGRAPVREPRQVLEVASGTGIWALEYATANPACHVTGTDISAIQQVHSLPNLNFVLHDFEKDAWPTQCSRDYDYIHLRHTLICFDSTPAVLRRAFELLRPGGWIEFYEPNMTFVRMDKSPLEGTAYAKWASLIVQVARRGGRDLTKTVHYAAWLREAGFVNVTEKRFGLPMNAWPKDERLKQIGRLSLKNELALVDSLGPALRKAVHDEEEAHAIEEGAKSDLQDPNMHVLRDM